MPWLPATIGAVYLVLFVARFPRLVERVYWDSDAASAAVLAQTAGQGTIVLQRFGWFTALWFALLTRPLPFHRQIWEAGPYCFSLLSVAFLTWASWRLAGRWAAFATATAAVATSPFVSYDLVTLNYHTTTWAATVVLAVFVLWLAHEPPGTLAAPATVLVTALAGTTLASDYLFAFTGVIPFALSGLVLLSVPRLRPAGVTVLASACLAPAIAALTSWGMRAAHVEVFSLPVRFADADDLWPNVGRLLRGIVQLVNGDYFFDALVTTRTVLSFACAVLMLIALSAPFVLLRRHLRSGTLPVPLLVYATFWACCITFNCLSFVLSSEGSHGGYYLIPILYATAASVPLVVAASPAGRALAGAGIAVVAITSFVNLADSETALRGDPPPISRVADRIVEIARKEHAQYGYADYWDATSLTWSKDMAVRVQPVSQCRLPESRELCPFWFNVNTSWYTPRLGKSFVLRDRSNDGVKQELPESLGRPSAVYELDDARTLYVYPYDVANRLDYTAVSWTPPTSAKG